MCIYRWFYNLRQLVSIFFFVVFHKYSVTLFVYVKEKMKQFTPSTCLDTNLIVYCSFSTNILARRQKIKKKKLQHV